MKPSVIVWDLETVPDLGGFAAANDLVGKSDVEVPTATKYRKVTEPFRSDGIAAGHALFGGGLDGEVRFDRATHAISRICSSGCNANNCRHILKDGDDFPSHRPLARPPLPHLGNV